MTITTSWKLNVRTIDALTVGETTFEDVVRTVHWRCIASDEATGERAEIYGSETLPEPEDPADYIDLSTLSGMGPDDKRSTVLGWAEEIRPGFVAEVEARTTAALEAKLAAPKRATVALL